MSTTIIVTEDNIVFVVFLLKTNPQFQDPAGVQTTTIVHECLLSHTTYNNKLIQLVNTKYDTKAQKYSLPLARIFRMMVVDV